MMQRYDSYKPSGEKWLGEIPSHWEIERAKNIFFRMKREVRPEDEIITCFRDGQVTLRKNRRLDGFTEALQESGYQGIRENDLVIHQMDAFAGSIGVSDSDGKGTPVYICCVPKIEANVNYYSHLLREMSRAGYIKALYRGIRERSSDFRYETFKDLPLPVPPLDEQNAIVNYLDKETAKIDRAIEAQQKMIDTLNERIQITISQAVTKGIDPEAPIGEIGFPKHWNIRPLRFVFEIRNGYTPSKANPAFWEDGTIPWYRMEDIRKNGRRLNEAIQYVTPKAVKGQGTFSAGSFILAICTASIGEHAMLIADSLANQRFANFKIRKSLSDNIEKEFMFYYMYVIADFCRNNANSTCFQYVDMPGLKRYPILIPPIAEQKRIVEYLDIATADLRQQLSNCQRMIELLTERKQIIISQAVTGKVKVS